MEDVAWIRMRDAAVDDEAEWNARRGQASVDGGFQCLKVSSGVFSPTQSSKVTKMTTQKYDTNYVTFSNQGSTCQFPAVIQTHEKSKSHESFPIKTFH
jgi:hypothetical protein